MQNIVHAPQVPYKAKHRVISELLKTACILCYLVSGLLENNNLFSNNSSTKTLGTIDVLDTEMSRHWGSKITCIHISVPSEDITKGLMGQHV